MIRTQPTLPRPGCLAPAPAPGLPLVRTLLSLPAVAAPCWPCCPRPHPAWILEATHQRVWWQGSPYRVPPRGLDILHLLARSHPQPLTAAQLARQLRDTKGVHTTDTQVRMAIRRLHQRLPAGPAPLIVNRRPGYCLTHFPAGLMPVPAPVA